MATEKKALRNKAPIIITFALLIVAVLFIAYAGNHYLSEAKRSFDHVISQHNVKTDAMTQILGLARQRSLALQTMLLTDDPFELDELHMLMYEIAEKYRMLKDFLLQLELSAEERQLLERQEARSMSAGRIQNQIAELIISGGKEQARSLLYHAAIPGQKKAMQLMNEFIFLQGDQNTEELSVTADRLIQDAALVIILVIPGCFTCIVIVYLMVTGYYREILKRSMVETEQKSISLELEHQQREHSRELTARQGCSKSAGIAYSSFLADMSHEIRTPINAVLTMAELLSNTALDEEQKQYIQNILHSGESLEYILNDILDFSELESDTFKLNQQPFDFLQLIRETAILMDPLADKQNLPLILDTDINFHHMLTGDSERIRQVLTNLISNAIKFTRTGSITVKLEYYGCSSDRHVFRVRVIDTGIGIAQNQHQRLFNRYTRVEQNFSGARPGSGLGLAICKRIITRMNGAIGVNSSPGKGSCFWFELALPVSDPVAETTDIGDLPDNPVRQTYHVLIVDDDPISLLGCSKLLELQGHHALGADSAEAALSLLKKTAVDAVLMDVHMPGMSGIECTRVLRKSRDARLRSLPVIGLTACVMEEQRQLFLAAGMDTILPKPFDSGQVDRELNRLCAPAAGKSKLRAG